MITTESIKNISVALLGFHGEVGMVRKNAHNPFFKTLYADLPAVLEAIHLPLINNRLAIVQFPESEYKLTTRLIHESGEWMQSTFDISPIPEYKTEKDRNGGIVWRGESYVSPQALGSAITYARRYAIGAILNLNIDQDDDGNRASMKPVLPTETKKLVAPVTEPKKPSINEKQLLKAIDRIKAGEKNIISKMKESFSLTADQLKMLETK